MLKPVESTIDHYNATDLEIYTGKEPVFYAVVIEQHNFQDLSVYCVYLSSDGGHHCNHYTTDFGFFPITFNSTN